MEVRFTVTLDDYVAFSLHVARKSGVGRRAQFFVGLLVPVFCTVGAVCLLIEDFNIFSLVAAVFLVLVGCGYSLVFWLIYPRMYWWIVERQMRAYATKLGTRGITGENTIVFSEEVIVGISETSRTEVRWENVEGVEEVGDHTYLFVSGVSAWILPRSGFDTDEEYYAVRDFALRKLSDRVRS